MINKPVYPILVHPEFSLEARDIWDFLMEFGPANGRYVPHVPSNWLSDFENHMREGGVCERETPVARKRLIERASRQIKHCVVPTDFEPPESDSWDACARSFREKQKDAVIVGSAIAPEPYEPWVQALLDIRLDTRRSWAFSGTIREYINDCYPLLVNAPVSYLIDPYLNPFSKDGEELIKSIYVTARKSKKSKCDRIEIITWRHKELGAGHTDRKKFDDEVQAQLLSAYSRAIPSGKLKLHLIEERHSNNRLKILHDRFFMTRFGGISFGRGYAIIRESKEKVCNAFVLDANHHQQLKHQYIDAIARHVERLPLPKTVSMPSHVTTYSLQTGF